MSDAIFHTQQRKTQTLKRFLTYTESLKNDPEVAKQLRWFRSHFRKKKTKEPFPIDGLPFPKSHVEHMKNCQTYSLPSDSTNEYQDFLKKHDGFKEKYKLDYFHVASELLVFYNTTQSLNYFGVGYMAGVVDMKEYRKEIKNWAYLHIHGYNDTFYGNWKAFPIGILINPYMSERDIVDFVKKVYKNNIKPLQEKHRDSSLGIERVRGKSKTLIERNDFIYKNRKLPILALMRKVNEKYCKTYSYTYIQTLLKKEEEKRK